jgi:hypothetical protein
MDYYIILGTFAGLGAVGLYFWFRKLLDKFFE